MIYEHTITVLLHSRCAGEKPGLAASTAQTLMVIWRWVKRQLCKMGCIFCIFGILMFYGGFVEGTVSLSAALLMWITCIQTCRNFYWLAGGEKLYQRRMLKRARRQHRMRTLKARIIQTASKVLESNGNRRY